MVQDNESRGTGSSRSLRAASKLRQDEIPFFDRQADMEIPRRLISFRETGGRIELRRAMTAEERMAIEERIVDLEFSLEPFKQADCDLLMERLAAMFAG